LKTKSVLEIEDCLQASAEPANNVTMWMPRFSKAYLNNKYRSGFPSLVMLKENLATTHLGLVFRQFSPYYESFNAVIVRMISSGLPQKWYQEAYRNNLTACSTKTLNYEIGPRILTLDHLGVGFYACMIPLGLAIVAFFAEIFYAAIRRFWINVKSKLSERIFQAFIINL